MILPDIFFAHTLRSSADVATLLTAKLTVSPVFYFTSVELGGWEFTPPMISLFFAGVGVAQAIWLLFVFPPLQKKYGTVAVLKGCMIGWPILLLVTPACNWLLRNNFRTAFVSWTLDGSSLSLNVYVVDCSSLVGSRRKWRCNVVQYVFPLYNLALYDNGSHHSFLQRQRSNCLLTIFEPF